jgi:hypothetical protein
MPSTHAVISPSAAEMWSGCPGSVAFATALGLEDTSSDAANEGTAAHFLAAECLVREKNAEDYTGQVIALLEDRDGNTSEVFYQYPGVGSNFKVIATFDVDTEMAAYVQEYVDNIRQRVADLKDSGAEVELRVEQRIDLSEVLGIPESYGTSDVVIISTRSNGTIDIEVDDLKYGMGNVVYASKEDGSPNKQLLLYAAGVYVEQEMFGDIKLIALGIHQPRRSHFDRAIIEPETLTSTVAGLRVAAQRAHELIGKKADDPELLIQLFPSESACKWCRAKAVCPKLADHVASSLSMSFDDLTAQAPQDNKQAKETALEMVKELIPEDAAEHLAQARKATTLVRMWCDAVEGTTQTVLVQGGNVPGWKLVPGKKGNKAWGDETEAENTLKAMRVKKDDMYNLKLISPTQAEKLHKEGTIGDRQWPKLQGLITQSEGKPTVVPESDPREPINKQASAESFDDLTAQVDDLF